MTSRSSGYAGRHRDPVAPAAEAPPTGHSHQLLWLFGGAVVVVMLLFSVLVYPSLTGSQTPQTGARPATSSTSDRGLQFLGAPEGGGTGTEWPNGASTLSSDPSTTSTTSTADPTSSTATTEPGTTSAEVPTPSRRAPVSPAPSTSNPPAPGTTPPVTSSTPSGTATADNPRVVARTLFPQFGFADSQFGCLNTMWNRLGLWGTAAQVRPGLIYVKGRYGTPCAAWDEVQRTGSY
ncbi:MAG TPA: hypothetical protein VFT68_08085 [Lapillicoccus sp.]|nr:hypothetical protein [Lapillicoccus sp.]